MVINGNWIYWKEQCFYCLSRHDCNNLLRVRNYIEELCKVNDKGIYGTLEWKCDYLVFDELKYKKLNVGECSYE